MQGSLTDISVEQLLRALFQKKQTAEVTLQREEKSLTLFFEDGRLVAITHWRGSLMNPEVFQRAQSSQEKAMLLAWSRSKMSDVIADILSWQTGQFAVELKDRIHPPFHVPLTDLPGIIDKLKQLLHEWHSAGYAPPPQQFYLFPGDGEGNSDDLNPGEERMLSMLNFEQTVKENVNILARFGVPKVRIFLMLYRWREMGFIEWHRTLEEGRAAASGTDEWSDLSQDDHQIGQTGFYSTQIMTIPDELRELAEQERAAHEERTRSRYHPQEEEKAAEIHDAEDEAPAAFGAAEDGEEASFRFDDEVDEPSLSAQDPDSQDSTGLTVIPPVLLQSEDLEDAMQVVNNAAQHNFRKTDPIIVAHIVSRLEHASQEGDWDAVQDAIVAYIPSYHDASDKDRPAYMEALTEILETLRGTMVEFDLIAVTDRITSQLVQKMGKFTTLAVGSLSELLPIFAQINLDAAIYGTVKEMQERMEEDISAEVYDCYCQVITSLRKLLGKPNYERMARSLYNQLGRHFHAPMTDFGIEKKRAALMVLALLPQSEARALVQESMEDPQFAQAALDSMRGNIEAFLPQMLKHAEQHPAADTTDTFVEFLLSLDENPRSYFGPWLHSESPILRRHALKLLGKWGSAKDVPKVMSFLEGEPKDVIWQAIETASALLPKEKRDSFLVNQLQRAPESLKSQIAHLIAESGGQEAIQALFQILHQHQALPDHDDRALYFEMVAALGKSSNPRSLSLLIALAQKPEFQKHARLMGRIVSSITDLARLSRECHQKASALLENLTQSELMYLQHMAQEALRNMPELM